MGNTDAPPRRLNETLAAVYTAQGLKIYAYVQGTENLAPSIPLEYVVLDLDAQLDLTDMICREQGGCSLLEDCQRDVERARDEASYYREKARREAALPIEPATRGRSKLFKT